MTFVLPVVFDGVPLGKNFGDVHKDAQSNYTIVSEYWETRVLYIVLSLLPPHSHTTTCTCTLPASLSIPLHLPSPVLSLFPSQNQTVEVEFWAGNPRNNLMVWYCDNMEWAVDTCHSALLFCADGEDVLDCGAADVFY